MEELEKGLKEVWVFAVPCEEQVSTGQTSGITGDWTTNKIIHMEGPMYLAKYVAEDGLVGQHWEE